MSVRGLGLAPLMVRRHHNRARSTSFSIDNLPLADNTKVLFANITTKQVPDTSILSGRIHIVWADQPLIVPPPTNFYTSRYVPAMRDPDITHDLEWLQENHPDWITYGADQVTPLQSRPGDNIWEIDITSAGPRAYMLGLMLAYVGQGFRSIALDNVAITNGTLWVGHYVGSTPKTGPGDAGWTPNGNGGVWTPQFAGVQYEAAFETAIEDYLTYLKTALNAVGARLFINGKVYKNQIPAVIRMTNCADIWLWEGGHTRGDASGNYLIVDGLWESFYSVVRSNTTQRATVIYNEFATHSVTTMSNAEIAWVVSNFLLIKEARTYLTVTGAGDLSGYLFDYPPSFFPNLGPPVSLPTQVISAWVRNFTNGSIVVNSLSNDTADFTVPAGTWKDQFGTTVTPGANTLQPASGIVIVNQLAYGAGAPFSLTGGGSGESTFKAVRFDGAADYYARAADLTDAADTPIGIFSCWVTFLGGDGVGQTIFRNNNSNIGFTKRTDNKLSFLLRNLGATASFTVITTGTYVAGGGWHHVFFAWNTNFAAGAKIGKLYVDRVAVTVTKTDANGAFDVNASDASWAYVASPAGGNKLNGALAELYFAEGQYLDPATSTNLDRFVTAGLKPVGLGANGETPTGSSPSVYVFGPVNVFGANRGTGGTFAKHGAPIDYTPGPND